MLTYIIRRLLLMIPTLIGVTMLVFFIMANAPGGFQSALDEGNQTTGDEARRLKQRLTNRYALDKPTHVQYLRWLNQVSPIGFKMTGDVEWTDEQTRAVEDTLESRDYIKGAQQRTARAKLILTIAAYSGKSPDEVVDLFDAAAASPVPDKPEDEGEDKPDADAPAYAGPAVDLFDLIDAEPIGEDAFWIGLAKTAEQQGSDRAVGDLFRELDLSTTGKSRIQFNAIKLWSPDLGTDQNNRKVGELILERLPITLILNLITIPLIYIVSIVAGVLAARRRGGVFDVGSSVIMLGLYSIPVMLTGTLMIAYLASAEYPTFQWFPASGEHDLKADEWPFLPYEDAAGDWQRGWLLDHLWHLVLPVICLTYAGFAFLTKVMRGAVLETVSADFVRTARAKGVSEKNILFRHVLRNSLLPLITMAAAILPGLFVGSFIVEYIFSIQGMGLLTIEAAKNADINIIMATTLVGSILSLLSLLLRDICYAIADPRVTYD
ncbi:MAG: ABC transporter permease [Phycisphaeraceae bacterium]